MKNDVASISASPTGLSAEPQTQATTRRIAIRDVTLNPSGSTPVRGFSLATLAAALAACGGGGGGGPSGPPPPPPNTPPTATDATGSVNEDGTSTATGDAVGQDADAGDTLSYSVPSDDNGEYGTLSVDGSSGAWTYELDNANSDVQALAAGATLTDTAKIEVSDGEASASATVTITITGANDNPTGDDGTGSVIPGTPVDGTAEAELNAADTDAGDTLTYSVQKQPSYGTLSVDEAGKWTYTLDNDNAVVKALPQDGTTTDTGVILIRDNNGGTDEADITITITGINDDPTGVNGAGALTAGFAAVLQGDVDRQDVDAGDTHTFEVVSDTSFGTLSVNDKGVWSYRLDEANTEVRTLDTGETLLDTGTIRISDNNGGTAQVTVTVTITGINDAPTAPSVTPSASNLTIDENDTSGRNLAEVRTQDAEGDSYTFAVDNANFEIELVGSAALLKVKDGVALDYEATPGGEITLMLTATDSAGNRSQATSVVVTVRDVNEAPTISAADGVLEENTTGTVGSVIISDPEETLTASDISVSDSRFSIATDADGALSLVLDQGIDQDALPPSADSKVRVTLTVTDSQGASASDEVVLTVTGVNESPSIRLQDAITPSGVAATRRIAENTTGPVAQILVSDQEDTLTAADITLSDPRFIVTTDSKGGLWLELDEPINYEQVAFADVTVTVTDSGGKSASVDNYTITILDANDAPAPNQTGVREIVKNASNQDEVQITTSLNATASTAINTKLDLGGMFSDEDGDTNFRYTLEDAPSWLNLINVQFGSDGSVTGVLQGTPPKGTAQTIRNIKILATDDAGASGRTAFDLVVDDGNDGPTAITFKSPSGDTKVLALKVNENDASGPLIGYLKASDLDDPNHPNGQHTWTSDYADDFEFVPRSASGGEVELRLKRGVVLNHEAQSLLTINVTATDGGGKSFTRGVDIEVADRPDGPVVANTPGNWWVTAPRKLDPEDVAAGQWLRFELETSQADGRPLFTDEDVEGGSGDVLAYTIVRGPSWLELDRSTGVFQNKKGMVAERGIYDVTVRATDKKGLSAQASFKIAVALSDPDDDDNDSPDVENTRGVDIKEGSSAGTVVATFSVRDDDLDLAGIHPWGNLEVSLTAIRDDTDAAIPADYFKIEQVSTRSNAINYQVVLTDKGAAALDHESYEDIELTITATDGVNATDTREINFDVDDRNEAPQLVVANATDSSGASTQLTVTGTGAQQKVSYEVMQQESDVVRIYLNLVDLYEDEDQGDGDDDINFSVNLRDAPWLKILHGPRKWEDIKDGPDDDANTSDDVSWGSGLDTPADDDVVVILELDRTGSDGTGANARSDPDEIDQDRDGVFSVTARDEGRASTTTNIIFAITDENLDPRADGSTDVGVYLSRSSPRQGDRLTMRFEPTIDPDFDGQEAGRPVVVLYLWETTALDSSSSPTGALTLKDVDIDDAASYTVVQDDADRGIKGSVVYYEMFQGGFVVSSAGDALAALSNAVRDRPDKAEVGIALETTSADKLKANVMIDDPDGRDPGAQGSKATLPTYTWQSSVNGRGGWTDLVAEQASNLTDLDAELTVPANVTGQYVRLVVTFKDENGSSERHEGDALKVGTIDTLSPPTIVTSLDSSGNAPLGATLRISVPSGTSVQWQTVTQGAGSDPDLVEDIPGATGNSFKVTTAQYGKEIQAVISTKDANGNVTSIVTTDDVDVVDAPANTAPVRKKDEQIFDVGAAKKTGELFKAAIALDMPRLFDDVETPEDDLTFDFSISSSHQGSFGSDQYNQTGVSVDVYLEDNNNTTGDQLLVVDEAKGQVNYYTTMAQGHDGSSVDGDENILWLELDAVDPQGARSSTGVEIGLRIDVKDTGANVTSSGGGTVTPVLSDSGVWTLDTPNISENTSPVTSATTILTFDIQDQNDNTHKYGIYNFSVDDKRFTVTSDPKTDGSIGVLKLNKGQALDWDDPALGEADGGVKSFDIMVTATPQVGNFPPVKFLVTVNLTNLTSDDSTTPAPSSANKVPGLQDDESSDDDDTTDSDGDSDDDGGAPLPTSIGLLEDGILF